LEFSFLDPLPQASRPADHLADVIISTIYWICIVIECKAGQQPARYCHACMQTVRQSVNGC